MSEVRCSARTEAGGRNGILLNETGFDARGPLMRLTEEQQNIIRETTREVFGAEARVWLFGSRVDDSRRGGDIDLYVEVPEADPASVFPRENLLYARLQRRLGEQRLDIVARSTKTPPQRIHEQARATGVPL